MTRKPEHLPCGVGAPMRRRPELGWAPAVAEQLIIGNGLSGRARWRLGAAPLTAWPEPEWSLYKLRDTSTESGPGCDIGLFTIALVGALSLGWLGGSSLYDWLCFKAPDPTDRAAISALIEKIEPGARVKGQVQCRSISVRPRAFSFLYRYGAGQTPL